MKEVAIVEIADSTALPADLEKCVNGYLLQEMAGNTGGFLSEAATSREMSRGGSGRRKRATAQ
jgi:hypothetical protein